MFHQFFPPDNHVHFNLTMDVLHLKMQERWIMRDNYPYMYDVYMSEIYLELHNIVQFLSYS
jgi:hypothetical protein